MNIPHIHLLCSGLYYTSLDKWENVRLFTIWSYTSHIITFWSLLMWSYGCVSWAVVFDGKTTAYKKENFTGPHWCSFNFYFDSQNHHPKLQSVEDPVIHKGARRSKNNCYGWRFVIYFRIYSMEILNWNWLCYQWILEYVCVLHLVSELYLNLCLAWSCLLQIWKILHIIGIFSIKTHTVNQA